MHNFTYVIVNAWWTRIQAQVFFEVPLAMLHGSWSQVVPDSLKGGHWRANPYQGRGRGMCPWYPAPSFATYVMKSCSYIPCVIKHMLFWLALAPPSEPGGYWPRVPASGIKSKYKFEYKNGLRSDLRASTYFLVLFWWSMPQIPLACAHTIIGASPPPQSQVPSTASDGNQPWFLGFLPQS